MSTRGYIGIRKNDMDKGGYNHFDSYPTGRGDDILKFIQKNNIDSLNELYDKIDTNYHDEDVWDCYNNKMNEKFEDYNNFIFDSLFCEYAYIINLDENILEFYRGFNKDSNADGRYAYKIGENGYCGVRLVMEIPLQEIFDNKWQADEEKDFIKKGN